MKVLDLFSGLCGWSQPFRDRGHDVTTIDIEKRFKPDIVADIGTIEPDTYDFYDYDIILASPPCEKFSVLRMGFNWDKTTPKNQETIEAVILVKHTLDLIKAWNPKWWIMENPKGRLRDLPFMKEYERHTVTYCGYGEYRQKPTDLWGVFPPSLELWLPCNTNDTCHQAVPRGSNKGTAGYSTPSKSAKIPYLLALDVCLAAEEDLK